MKFKQLQLEGCILIEPDIYQDHRGCFFESFNQKDFVQNFGLNVNFVQDNVSVSKKGTLRGLHYQKGNYAQAKLVVVLVGKVLDVVVDLRQKSPTFGQYLSVELSGENRRQLFIPRGMAHGFLVLEDDTLFHYKCDNYYNKSSESGVRFNDPNIAIDWQMNHHDIILSEKDKKLPYFRELL